MKQKTRLLRMIEEGKQDSIKFLQKMISYDTTVVDEGVYGNEGEAQKWLAEKFKEMGCEVETFEPDNEKIKSYSPADYTPGHNYEGRFIVAGKIKGEGGGRSLLIDGHIDTVPIGNASLWKHNPLDGDIEGGKIYGRGACDMKAGHAATIKAVEFIKKAGIKLKGDLTLLSVVDEERGEGNGCLAYLERGYRADAALFAEGTNMEKIVIGSQGLLLGKIKVRGKACHSTIKWQGINAIEKMIRIIDELGLIEKEWSYSVREPGLGPALISVGRIAGGTEVNCIPEECEIYFNVIYLPMQSDEKGRGTKVKQEIEERIALVCQGDVWLAEHPAEITWLNEITPSIIDQNHNLVKIMKSVAEDALENDVEVGMGELPSMSRIMNDLANMPMIMFGPGSIEQAHAIDEWCSVDQYLQAIKILAMFIVEWCGESNKS
jgi:acetylornithine deacetylase